MIRFALAVFFLFLVTGLVLAAYARVLSRRGSHTFWPNEEPAWARSSPAWWRYGDVTWRGYVRAMPFGGLIGGLLGILDAWCFMLLTSLDDYQFVRNGMVRTWLLWAFIIGFGGMVITALFSITVFLLNWPKALVAPGLRHQPGALKEWWGGG